MGTPWIVATPEHERAFRKDWLVYKLPLDEMAALHGFRSHRGVYQTVIRLGLPLRQPRDEKTRERLKVRLSGGYWVQRGPVQVWIEDEDRRAS